MEANIAIPLGARVTVTAGTGTVRFFGQTAFAAGSWVGIELDEPSGKVSQLTAVLRADPDSLRIRMTVQSRENVTSLVRQTLESSSVQSKSSLSREKPMISRTSSVLLCTSFVQN